MHLTLHLNKRSNSRILERVAVQRRCGMKFRTRFWFGVVARGGRGLFSRDRISPFVPSPGMRVFFKDDHEVLRGIPKDSPPPPLAAERRRR